MSKIKQLAAQFASNQISGYLIATTDEYLSEYPPAYSRRLEYISGFSGSSGFAIMQEDKGLFFTDGRYTEQAAKELDTEYFTTYDFADIKGFPWYKELGRNVIVGYDPKLFSQSFLDKLKGLQLKDVEINLIDQIWPQQPAKPNSDIWQYDEEYAGRTSSEKLTDIRSEILDKGAKNLALTHSESICWLLNIRAKDLDFTPVALLKAIVTQGELQLFIDENRIGFKVPDSWKIRPEGEFAGSLKKLEGKTIIDPSLATSWEVAQIPTAKRVTTTDPCIKMKAVKNEVEIERIKKGHIEDAVAICEFLAQLYSLSAEELKSTSEWDLGNMLAYFRQQRPGYYTESFAPICGFKDNSAVIHYKAQKEMAKRINGRGLLLVDSGGQYLGATTDTTRTICIGTPTEEERKMYSLVLQGHLNLTASIFPEKTTTGSNLDVVARQPLWQEGYDFAHGTGHGVGAFLGVHEGPQCISQQPNNVALRPNMVLSNEPGFYKPGHFGVRIENLVYVTASAKSGFLTFVDLTLVPYCKELINIDMLTNQQKIQINQYYKKIEKQVAGKLSPRAREWLDGQLFI